MAQLSSGSFAVDLALGRFGAKTVAVLSPYAPVGDTEVTRFLTESGYEVKGFTGLRCATPVAIAEVSEDEVLLCCFFFLQIRLAALRYGSPL